MNDSLPDGYHGVIHDDAPEDLWLGASVTKFPHARHSWAENKFQEQQTDVQEFSCTLHGTDGAVEDNAGIQFTLAERKHAYELAKQDPIIPFNDAKGWVTNKAVDLWRKIWNDAHPKDQISTFAISLGSELFDTVIGLGYSCTVSYKGNQAYNADAFKDGVLDMTSFGVSTYGHCLRVTASDDPNNYTVVVDNYPNSRAAAGLKNVYEIPKAHWAMLVSNGVFFPNSYIFVFVNDLGSMGKISPWAAIAVAKAIKKGLTTEDANFQDPIPIPAYVEDDFIKLGIFTKKMGIITRERWYVALDKAGLLQ